MFLRALVFICTLYLACAADDVLELSDNDFDKRLTDHKVTLVMFYAPWCSHCKRLKPEYAKAAEELETSNPSVALVKVDCTGLGKETCERNGVTSYPTLKIYRSGNFLQEYDGSRDASDIVKYMKAQVGPSSKELRSMDDLHNFLNEDKDITLVGFFEDDSELKTVYLDAADKMRGKFRFAHTSEKDLLTKHGIKDDGIILFRPAFLHNKFENSTVAYLGNGNFTDIYSFIKKHMHGLVGYRTIDNMYDFKQPLVVAYFDVNYEINAKVTSYWRNRVLSVAKLFEGKINFAISPIQDFLHDLNEFGMNDAENVDTVQPTVVARNGQNQKFIMNETFSIKTLQEFVRDVLNGNLKPYVKSQNIPPNNNGFVKIAVAKNFDDIVMHNGKDTFVQFYAPWCGDCKKLSTVYEKLGERLQHEDVVVLVKMDAAANDIPKPYVVTDYPTLYWASKDAKENPVKYDGGHHINDFIKFIAGHATFELKGYDRNGKLKTTKVEL